MRIIIQFRKFIHLVHTRVSWKTVARAGNDTSCCQQSALTPNTQNLNESSHIFSPANVKAKYFSALFRHPIILYFFFTRYRKIKGD